MLEKGSISVYGSMQRGSRGGKASAVLVARASKSQNVPTEARSVLASTAAKYLDWMQGFWRSGAAGAGVQQE